MQKKLWSRSGCHLSIGERGDLKKETCVDGRLGVKDLENFNMALLMQMEGGVWMTHKHCGLFCYNSDTRILHENSRASKLRMNRRVWITLVCFKYQQCVMWWYTNLLLKGKMDRQQNLEGFIPSSTLIIKPRTDKAETWVFSDKN